MDDGLTKDERKRLYLRLLFRAAVLILVVMICALCMSKLLSMLLPFALALLIACILDPLVRKLSHRFGASRGALSILSVVILVALLAALLFTVVYNVVAEIQDIFDNWTTIRDSFVTTLQQLSALFDNGSSTDQTVTGMVQKGIQWLTDTLNSWSPKMVTFAGDVFTGIVNFVLSFLVFILSSYFFTSDYPLIKYWFRERLPRGLRHRLSEIRAAAGTAMGSYLKAQLILEAMVFLILFVGFLISRQKYAIIVALLTAIVDFLPFFGCGAVLIPWALISLLTGSWGKCLFLLCLSWGIFLFRKIAEPKVVGDQTGLSPLLSLICIYIGMKLWGVLGMIFVPILCMMLISLKKSGVFDDLLNDLSMALRDIMRIIRQNG